MTSFKPPLESYPHFRATDVDAITTALGPAVSSRIADWRSVRGTPDVRINHVPLSVFKLWYCAYGLPIRLGFAQEERFRIQLNHSGVGATTVNADRVPITREQACISSGPIEIDYGLDFSQLTVTVEKAEIVRKLAALTGGAIVDRFQCDAALDLTKPEAAYFERSVRFLVQQLDQSDTDLPPLVLTEMEQALMVAFLWASRHNYSDALRRPTPNVAPRQVRMIEEYVAANWNRPIRMEDLVRLTGCSARTLFRAFKQARGHSPMAFAKQVRLEHARRMLTGAESATVTDIAFACGFGDLGRFSKEYRRAFGESPLQVLKRGRRGA